MFRTSVILALLVAGTAQAVSPVRLQIAAMPGTLRQGERAKIDAQFLGREYQPVANDSN
jgi:hypothetical protein